MKRDVTRTGHRTHKGAWDDAMAGARRYFVNNFRDKSRQRGVDLLLGESIAHASNCKNGSNLLNLRGGANVTTNLDESSGLGDGMDLILREILQDLEGAVEDEESDTPVSDLYLTSTPYLRRRIFSKRIVSVVERSFSLFTARLFSKKLWIYLVVSYVLSLIVRINM